MFKIYDGRKEFYQWDIKQKLIVEDPTIDEVHFCNRMGSCSFVREVYCEDGVYLVNVPNTILQDNMPIKAYAYDLNHTEVSETFNVVRRTRPEDYVYTDEEQKVWDDIEARVSALEENGGANIDLSTYATKTYVDDAVAAIDIPEVDLEPYALKTEIPDVSGYQTAEQVQAAITAALGEIGVAEEGAY